MAWTSTELTSPTGATLNVYSALPKGRPKAIIHINHGMAEHAVRYERFAKALVKAGYGVFAHDHRGHGQTTAPDTTLGHFGKDGWNKVIEDVAAVATHIIETHDAPLLTFGHSMGSIIALNFALRYSDSIFGLALWNAGVDTGALATIYGGILKTERFFKGSDVPSSIANKLTFDAWNKEFAPNRTEFDWLSRDEAEVDKYVNDPLCGFPVTIGLWLDVLSGIKFAANNVNLQILKNNLPVHLQAGDQDPCSEKGNAVSNIERRMKALGMSDVTFNLLEDTRHESLNEINRDEVTAEFIEWLDARFVQS